MEDHVTAYCRLCAEQRNSDKMQDLTKDIDKLEDIHMKLMFLNAAYIDLPSESTLPKTICFVCQEELDKSYQFFCNIKKAQTVLLDIFPHVEPYSDDDKNFDDCPEDATVKNEISLTNNELDIKIEPKDEDVDKCDLDDIFEAALRCSPVYETEGGVKKSISKWKDYPWICAFCNIEFLDIGTLRLHSRLTHGRCNAFSCVFCKNFECTFFIDFINHVRKHKRKLRKRCEYCDVVFSGDDIKKHTKEHFKEELPCHYCGDTFSKDKLQEHIEEFEPIKPKRKRHKKRGVPITIDDLTCKLCNKVYKSLNSLRDHQKLHSIDRKKEYTCERCGKMFYNKGTLTSHIMAHDQVRPHVCRICNKSFSYPNMLRRHVDMHSGVKPFSCEQCGRCFRLQYQLNAHKIIHTDAMPHVCKYCNKAFRFKQILKNHERQHTGDKPYECEHCSMKFTNWSNYNKHMKRRHNMDTSKKKITPEGVFPINPQTGELVQVRDASTEEWKNRIMVPGKRGKKVVKKSV